VESRSRVGGGDKGEIGSNWGGWHVGKDDWSVGLGAKNEADRWAPIDDSFRI
jgi:hypothetical protein